MVKKTISKIVAVADRFSGKQSTDLLIKTPWVREVLLFLYLFYLSYVPTFGRQVIFSQFLLVNGLALMIGLVYLWRRDYGIFQTFKDKRVLMFVGLIFASSVFFFVRMMITKGAIPGLKESRIVHNNMPTIYLFHAFVIFDNFKKLKYDQIMALKMIMSVILVQAMMAVTMAMIPAFRDVARWLYALFYSNDPFIMSSRLYGISADYTFATPIYHGLMAAVALFVGISKDRSLLIYVIPTLVLTALNGRTGVLVFGFLLAVLVIIFLFAKGLACKQKVIKGALAVLVGGLSVWLAFSFVNFIAVDTYNHAIQAVTDTIEVTEEKAPTGSYDHLLNHMVIMPEGVVDWLFGRGHRVFGAWSRINGLNQNSDIGYVNDLFMGGLVYIVLLYGAYVSYFWMSARRLLAANNKSRFWLGVLILLGLALLIANFKGEILKANTTLFAIFVLTELTLYNPNKDDNDSLLNIIRSIILRAKLGQTRKIGIIKSKMRAKKRA